MKITKERFNRILLEEKERLQKSLNQDQQRETEEKKLAHTLYVFLNHTRGKFEEYLGGLPEGEEPSEECQALFDSVAKMWELADNVLTGGETRQALPDLFGDTEEEDYRI